MAMENGSLISDFPIKASIYRGFSSQPCLITRGQIFGAAQHGRMNFPGLRFGNLSPKGLEKVVEVSDLKLMGVC